MSGRHNYAYEARLLNRNMEIMYTPTYITRRNSIKLLFAGNRRDSAENVDRTSGTIIIHLHKLNDFTSLICLFVVRIQLICIVRCISNVLLVLTHLIFCILRRKTNIVKSLEFK